MEPKYPVVIPIFYYRILKYLNSFVRQGKRIVSKHNIETEYWIAYCKNDRLIIDRHHMHIGAIIQYPTLSPLA